ncbi:MAG: hypothetical protein NTV51_11940, partial [Verrucomicrobia bacterium]|nr:hypothetical protein [Verrucomicrobiota bacterium]
NDDDLADGPAVATTATFERTRTLDFTLPPHATTIVTLKLKTPGTPYAARPDLGLDREDVTLDRTTGRLRVKVHSLGSVATPATTVQLRDRLGRTVATAPVAVVPAPRDLIPKTIEILLPLPLGFDLAGSMVEIDPEHRLTEITTCNNTVKL